MNYGLYMSAAGAMTNHYRQDVYANNLANVETAAFKPDLPTIKQRDPQRIERDHGFDVSQRLLERLGGGVLAGPQHIDFSAGPMRQTDNPLDVALPEDDTFFTVGVGEDELRLTRDGRFTRAGDGQLVTVTGHPVLDVNDQPIVLNTDAPAGVTGDGRVVQGDQTVAQLGVWHVADTSRLSKQAANLFAFEGGDPRQLPARPQLQPGFIEASGVNPIASMMAMISASKAAIGNTELIRYQDVMMDQAVNTLGRIRA